MSNRNWIRVFIGVVFLGLLSTASAAAMWNANRTTYFTFNRSVQIPGATLPAGTYVFELADPNHSLDVVRVLSKDRKRVFLTAFTRPAERPRDKKLEAAIVFGETSPGIAPPIKVWYPQDERTGRQFIY